MRFHKNGNCCLLKTDSVTEASNLWLSVGIIRSLDKILLVIVIVVESYFARPETAL